MITATNPHNGEPINQYPLATDAEIDSALAAAKTAFENWRSTSINQRTKMLQKAAEVLLSKKDKYAHLISLEMGKPIAEAIAEIEKCALCCNFYAEHAETFLAPEHKTSKYSESWVEYQPLGTILAVMPWNYPFWQVFRFAAPALAAGNTAILKHASNVPGCCLGIEEVFRLAGVPKGVFQSLILPSSKVPSVIESPIIKAVTLTGSETAGSEVAALAGKHIKKTVLELGGSDPFIVFEDADLPAAIEAAIKSRFLNTGQSCISAKRFFLERNVHDAFIEGITEKISALKQGDPLQEGNDLGPLAKPEFVSELHKQVLQSIAMGAELVLGGVKPKGTGNYYPPTLLTNISPEMPVSKQETFGPVMCVSQFNTFEELISLCNSSQFGLGASVWTKNLEKAKETAKFLENGCIFINDFVKSDPALPFGGIKKSGYGRELAKDGMLEFMNLKTIVIK